MYQVNAIYPTYQGEQNVKGIGAPVIFLRLQGCHLRCYLKTLGILCDTPEALEKRGGGRQLSLVDLVAELLMVREATGISFICLSGGDPMWRKKEDISALLEILTFHGFVVSIETSGTISIQPYAEISNVHFVLDYKLLSAGVTEPFCEEDLPFLDRKDIIKFVVYDATDMEQAIDVIRKLLGKNCSAQLVIGPYWGGKISSSKIVEILLDEKLLGDVKINAQLHKLLTHADNSDVSNTKIPTEL